MPLNIRRRASNTEHALTDSSLLNRIYSNRGISSAEELDYQLSKLKSFHSLTGIDSATKLLWQSLVGKEKVLKTLNTKEIFKTSGQVLKNLRGFKK